MTAKNTADEIVAEYLSRLEAELGVIPGARRQPIVDEIREHIAKGRADLDPADEVGLRELLDRVGDPQVIAAEAAADYPAGPSRRRDALVPWLLLAGGFAAVLGWFAGLVLLWRSRTWTLSDKLLGTLVLPGGLLGFVVLLFLPGSATSCGPGHATPVNATSGAGSPAATHCTTTGFSFPPAVGIVVFLVALLAPVVTAMRLEGVRRQHAMPRP